MGRQAIRWITNETSGGDTPRNGGAIMARYTDAVCRLCRREGQKLFLKGERCYSDKCSVVRKMCIRDSSCDEYVCIALFVALNGANFKKGTYAVI